ncbi:spermatogenesis-associated protein 7 homolog [Hemicordylus capensis]|uniref:spermatogenesis-associated protein 7 homolog n=1 Tax=Hemicordylus capensis TaxID=884348 RepID=UPI002303DE98|nr:spermatogenesis-associated protein 7 homolog [Hemicordylus capensis]
MEGIVLRKIQKEVALGRVLGPFDKLPLPNLRSPLLGVMPKKAPGEYRLIHHLSFPHGSSVNDGIPAEFCLVRDTSYAEAVQKEFLMANPLPDILVVHMGENDRVTQIGLSIIHRAQADVTQVQEWIPRLIVIWSNMLQRRVWKGARHSLKIERAHRKINTHMARFVQTLGGSQLTMIPKYSLMGPFRGHMSIKSSPFSPSSSCKLSSQCILQDHMATHYRKLLSAKAAVDSSAPKSLNTSIKYRDQQKRDKLIKVVEKYKEEMARVPSAPPFNSRSVSTKDHKQLQNNLNLTSSGRMASLKQKQLHFPRPLKMPLSRIHSPVLSAEETIQDIVHRSLLLAHNDGRNTIQQQALLLTKPPIPVLSCSPKKTFQHPRKKIFGGDLLQTHAQWFTETTQPFTPKVLNTASKSFLSKYRYYNPPHSKKNLSLGKQSYKRPRKFYRSLEDKCLRSYADYLIWHPVKKDSQNSVSLQSLIYAKEEELKYLQFLQELTNSILIRSCYCKEALDDVFLKHIRNRRYDLDEENMQRIFEALKADLNICPHHTGLEHRSQRLIAPYMEPSSSKSRMVF